MKDVATPSSIQAALESKRALPRLLVEGTAAMRAAGKAYLPQFPAEQPEDYEARRIASVLLPAYRDAIDLACGLIFRKKVEQGQGVPKEAEPWLDDIDRAGRNVTQFAESVFRDAFDGVSYIVADCPRASREGLTKAQEQAEGIRPYLIHVKARQVLGWRTQQVNGRQVLTQFRYKESTEELDGLFGIKTVERIRVLEPGMVSVYIKPDGKDWMLDPSQSGAVSLREVAAVPVYTGRTGFMTGEPPLADLAEKNAQHWRCDSDLQSVIHKCCVPLLKTIGLDNGTIVLGPNNSINVPLGGDAGWIELKGESIPTAQANIETLKDEMRAMAGKILDKGVVKTATEAGIESTQAMSRIQAWALGLQAGLNAAWALCGKWIGEDLGTLAVNVDVDTARPDAQYLTEIRNATAANLLSKQTYLRILQDAEALPEGFDLEEELDRLEKEAPDLEVAPPSKKTTKKATITRPDGSKSTVEME